MKASTRYGAVIAALLVLATATAIAGSIKVWNSGEVLTSSDLNANFAHIHNVMVGGHGARLVNADVNASAAIAHSKLATPALLPKAWAYASTTCTAGTCTLAASSMVTSVTFDSTGVYTLTRTTASADNFAAILCNCTVPGLYCSTEGTGVSTVQARCFDAAGVATNSGFSILVMDNN